MSKRKLIALLLLVVTAGLITVGVFVLCHHCPEEGIALTKGRREEHRLKNRSSRPQANDFDDSVSLSSLLQPGNDTTRWSSARAVRIEGFVVALAAGKLELCNCLAPCDRDTHIDVAQRPDAPSREHVVVEITPRMRAWAARQGLDWSEETLHRDLLGHWVQFEGWLFFDQHHADESENTAPNNPKNWRATAWEIHPITSFRVVH
ncbi:MAG: hypothetical protein C5B44_04235 [Acidobacteria bacterium]|nr:MAG: hypothetical protein C5B44_04235 [Acidobacteriota bacterium]